jgi:hypothetical protein
MSLKAFHLVFVTASVLMCLSCAAWGYQAYRGPDGTQAHLLFSVGSVLAGLALLVYGRYFLKKLRHISYL